ncbi:MAG: SMP-30/gluconolactonase/LRE family protein [Alphaproteobacteria bacterium]
MKNVVLAIGGLILAGALYLCLWPVPVAPESWEAPISSGYTDDFAPNEQLANLSRIEIENLHGPEDIAARMIDGQLTLFISAQDGLIRAVDAETLTSQIFADTGGVPLGLEFDDSGNLIVADAHKGLVSIAPNGEMTILTNSVSDTPILYADDVDIAPDGVIYFSDASTKFGAKHSGSTLAGSLLEIMEHGRTGRLLSYNPENGTTHIIKTGISFANGVAMAPDGQSVLVIETGEYRILRIWIAGDKSGETEVVIDNLPGFPDNINSAPDGSYFVGLVSKRSNVLDDMAAKPFMRKLIWRLPESLKPAAENYGLVFQMDNEGNVLQTWQDPEGAYPLTTGAIAPGDGWMYISSLGADHLGRRPFP